MNEPLRVQWIVDGIHGSPTSGYSSPLASNRYRVLAPFEALRRQGVDVSLLTAGQWDAASQTVGKADVTAIGKLAPGGDQQRVRQISERVLAQIELAQAGGVKVVADFNDDHFTHPSVGAYWRRLASVADVRVAGSTAMQRVLQRYSPQPVHLIGDPVLAEQRPPRTFRKKGGLWRPFGQSGRLLLLWFGNLNNWAALLPWIQALRPLADEQPWLLRVVTTPHPEIDRFADAFNREAAGKALVEPVEWSEEAQHMLLAESHIVLLPSNPEDPGKQVKTANRMSDALQAGNFVIASKLPAYEPYSAVVSLAAEPLSAIRAYLSDPGRHVAQVIEGQALVRSNASPDKVAALWFAAFEKATIAKRKEPSGQIPATADEPLVRLNLGCGDKILPGYVNVDVVASRSGQKPDVQCDLRQLTPFSDNSVDEVMAIHVVEHFWRWEIEAVLREWLRVLKPGGRMVLECPNLQSACEAFLADPEKASGEDAAGQRTMWVFYGDPQWRDPLMVHRWGYTPRSLSVLLEKVGLVGVRQEPAVYKLREPRDMRVVGLKP